MNTEYSPLSTSRGAGNTAICSHDSLQIISYRYLSTSKGVGNDVTLRLNSFVCGNCIASYQPWEGPEIPLRMLCSVTQVHGIDTCQPREGPETALLCFVNVISSCISPYLPREGPETCSFMLLSPFFLFLYRYRSTLRGAGNKKSYPIFICGYGSIDSYLPCEGPETINSCLFIFQLLL